MQVTAKGPGTSWTRPYQSDRALEGKGERAYLEIEIQL